MFDKLLASPSLSPQTTPAPGNIEMEGGGGEGGGGRMGRNLYRQLKTLKKEVECAKTFAPHYSYFA